MTQTNEGTHRRRSRHRDSTTPESSRRMTTTSSRSGGGSANNNNDAIPSSSIARRRHRVVVVVLASASSLLLLLLLILLQAAEAREIVATRRWQLLGENDTIPAGLHVRIDVTTGEKWARLIVDDDDDDDEGDVETEDEDGRVESAILDAGGALTIVDADDDDDVRIAGDSSSSSSSSPPRKDYEMMHRVMSKLPPEELDRFGGLPDVPLLLPSSSTSTNNETNNIATTISRLTAEQRIIFETRMEKLWNARQEELAKAQDGLADLPGMLRERIIMIREYLDDVEGGLGRILDDRRTRRGRRRVGDDDDDSNDGKRGDDDDDNDVVRDVVDALRDLEYLLSDVDMARDFHTLGGWSPLVTLLDDRRRATLTAASSDPIIEDEDEETAILVDEIRALAAMTIGTAVGNMGEFRPWALEDVSYSSSSSSSSSSSGRIRNRDTTSAVSLLISSFERELASRTEGMGGGTMAVAIPSESRYVARATYQLRATYALGSLLRGNPLAQRYFVSNGGPEALVRIAIGTLSNARGPHASANGRTAILDYKLSSRVLSLGEDVVMDVVLHGEDYDRIVDDADDGGVSTTTSNRLVAAFTTERWCDLSLRMLSTPSDVIGVVPTRGIRQRALTAVRAMAPACRERSGDASWGLEGVKRARSEWNREGSDDGLDPVYRKELLDLTDEVLREMQE